jgi:serine/threonine protein kinase
MLAQLLARPAAPPILGGASRQALLLSVVAIRELRPTPAFLASPPPSLESALLRVPAEEARSLAELLPNSPPLALDLLSKLLAFDPVSRLTAYGALSHDYFKGLVAELKTPYAFPVNPVDVADDTVLPFAATQCSGL